MHLRRRSLEQCQLITRLPLEGRLCLPCSQSCANAFSCPDTAICLQEFTNPDIANISCPVLNVMGLEDGLLGGQEAAFMAALNPTTAGMSKLITFNASSGAALHNQVIACNEKSYPVLPLTWLSPLLRGLLQTKSCQACLPEELSSGHPSCTRAGHAE